MENEMPEMKMKVFYADDDDDWLASAARDGWKVEVYCIRENLTAELALVKFVDFPDGGRAVLAVHPVSQFSPSDMPLYASVTTTDACGDIQYPEFASMHEAIAHCEAQLVELQGARSLAHA